MSGEWMDRSRELAAELGIEVPARASYPIPMDRLRASTVRQPRDDAKDVSDIRPSIAQHGLIHPIWVRHSKAEAGAFEVVVGERRWTALSELGASFVDAEVHDELTDLDIALIQLEENDRRRPLTALEQAHATQRLVAPKSEGGFGIADMTEIATRLGISQTVVYQRLALAGASAATKEALSQRRIYLGTALALASIHDHDEQARAVEDVLTDEGEEPLGVRRAARIVQDRYHLLLAKAPFDTSSASLVAEVGSCDSCPKRSGEDRQRSLFAATVDDEPEARCTDRACYRAKTVAARDAALAKAEASGVRVVPKDESKGWFVNGLFVASQAPGLVDLDAKPADGDGQTYSALLAGHPAAVPVAVAVDKDDRVHWLGDKAAVVAALQTKFAAERPRDENVHNGGPDNAPTAAATTVPEGSDAPAATTKPEVPEKLPEPFSVARRAEHDGGLEALGQIAAFGSKLVDGELDAHFWRFVLRGVLVLAENRIDAVVDRRELRASAGASDRELLTDLVTKGSADQLRGLLFEVLASIDGLHPRKGDDGHALRVACRYAGIDLVALVGEREKAIKADQTKVKAKAKPATQAKAAVAPGADKGADEKLERRICSVCRCTEAKRCNGAAGPCVWADAGETLCSICADIEARAVEMLAAATEPMARDELCSRVLSDLGEDPASGKAEVEDAIADAIRRGKLPATRDGVFVVAPKIAVKPKNAGATPLEETTLRTSLVKFMRSNGGQAARKEAIEAMRKERGATPVAVLREVTFMIRDKLVAPIDGSATAPLRLIAPDFDDVLEELTALSTPALKARWAEVMRSTAIPPKVVDIRYRLAAHLSGEERQLSAKR